MNVYLFCLMSFLLGLLASFPVFILALRRVTRRKMQEIESIKEAHRQAFQDLIHRMHHEGPIPKGATSAGLLSLITWAISNSIIDLKRLLEERDWNTSGAITNLQEIALNELRKLHKQIEDFLQSRRDILKEFDSKQGL